NFGHTPGHFGAHANMSPSSKIVTMPAKGMTPIKPGNFGNNGKFSRMSGRMNNNPMRGGNRHMFNSGPRHFGGGMGGGRFTQRFASGPSRMSFARGSFGGGRSFGGFGRQLLELRGMQTRAEDTRCAV